MTIQSVRVVSKSIAVCERFKQWLLTNAKHHQGEIYTHEDDAVLFTLSNTNDGIMMAVPGALNDRLALTVYRGMAPHIVVRYLENTIEDDGDEYLSVLNAESFGRADLHLALECFMARWNSTVPKESISPKPTEDVVKRIADILTRRNAFEAPKPVFDPINITMTPKDIRILIGIKKLAREMNEVCQSQFNSSGHLRELLLRTKHRDTRVEYIDTDGSKALSPTVRKMCEDTGVAVFEDRDHTSLAVKRSVASLPDVAGLETVFENGKPVGKYAVGYTGNKDNHGFGSLDHCSW